MRRAGYLHDVKRRLAILEELRKLEEEEACKEKEKVKQELMERNKSRRKSGKKLQRAQCRKEKRRRAVERERNLRFSKVVSYQAIKQRTKKSEERNRCRKMRRCGFKCNYGVISNPIPYLDKPTCTQTPPPRQLTYRETE
ncbi:unnamed protein product [Allacma fusca]|uniref:Uncharacterized protein n=1 Tax=Allacma fusca TaxID=39272 RepID=A0A8J2PNL0_9HEXA|nr:unnamed protein product [Allacma fusca]